MTSPILPSDVERIAAGLSKAQARDLTLNWDHFCAADHGLVETYDPNFPEALEAVGFVVLDAVDAADLETPFAWELGIEPGGMVWRLTPLGIAVRSHLLAQEKQS